MRRMRSPTSWSGNSGRAGGAGAPPPLPSLLCRSEPHDLALEIRDAVDEVKDDGHTRDVRAEVATQSADCAEARNGSRVEERRPTRGRAVFEEPALDESLDERGVNADGAGELVERDLALFVSVDRK